jgi:hypothetical protein
MLGGNVLKGWLIMLALVTLTPAAALAQESDLVAGVEYDVRLARLREIVSESARLVPSVEIFAKGEAGHAELEAAAAAARETEPLALALMAELDAMPALDPISDPKRMDGIAVLKTDVRSIVANLAKVLTTARSHVRAAGEPSWDELLTLEGAEIDTVRDATVALARSFMLDRTDTAGHAASEPFIHIANARGVLLDVGQGKITATEAREQLAARSDKMKLLNKRLRSLPDGARYANAIAQVRVYLDVAADLLADPKDDEIEIVAVLRSLQRAVREALGVM